MPISETYVTDRQGNILAYDDYVKKYPLPRIWHHARQIALDDILAHGCKRDELGNYCAKNGPLNGLWYKATMETFQKLIERSRHILSQAIQRVPVSNVDEGQLVAIKNRPRQKTNDDDDETY